MIHYHSVIVLVIEYGDVFLKDMFFLGVDDLFPIGELEPWYLL